MDNLAISFASLVKNNNGFFKSDTQAKFLLSKCQDPYVFTTMGTSFRSGWTLHYHCDDKGVTRVEKYLPNSGKTEVTWERKEEGKVTAQDAKEIKRIEREIKNVKKAIEKRKASFAKGEYKGMEDLYQRSMSGDEDLLTRLEALLKNFK